MELKDKVKTVRLKLMMSQQGFAKELGISYTTLNRWENGHWKPSYKGQRAFKDLCDRHCIKDIDILNE